MPPASPLQLNEPPRSVVRLNRRIIYVVGAVLILAFVAGLFAVRAQSARLAETTPQSRTALTPRSQPWFEQVPDQTPAKTPPPVLDEPSPSASPAHPTPAGGDEDEDQRRRRVLRAAMSAPIGVPAFERGGLEQAGRRRTNPEGAVAAPAGMVVAADRLQAAAAPPNGTASATPSTGRAEATASSLPPEYLRATVRTPVSPYELKAGTIVPGVMLTAINSDLPGQIIGQVRENVYDSDSGEYLLIPQGTRLVGLYDNRLVYGQQRVLIMWKRLILPNGSSLSLGDGMPGTDAVGAAGLHDQVNNHYIRTFANALLLSIVGAGLQLSQNPEYGQNFRGPSATSVLGAAVGQQFGSVSTEFIRRGMSISPTLDIRPGFAFNVMVTQDVILPGPYDDRRQP